MSSGIGYFFYLIGGALGELFGRREVLIVTAVLTAPLNLLFMFVHGNGWQIWLLYYLPGDERHVVGRRVRLLG